MRASLSRCERHRRSQASETTLNRISYDMKTVSRVRRGAAQVEEPRHHVGRQRANLLVLYRAVIA
jgi:hypothetical protein